MNDTRSPLRQDTLFYPSAALLELTGKLAMSTPTFSLPPFDDWLGQPSHTLPIDEPSAVTEPDPAIERRLGAVRESPGFRLIANSALLLKACQLDMDMPPQRHAYVRKHLALLLKQKTGQTLDPDQLHITFQTQTHPAVDDDGHEHYTRRLSLTQLAVISFDARHFMALYHSTIEDEPLSGSDFSLKASEAFNMILESTLAHDYSQVMKAFWGQHRQTFRALARLGLLDTVARQYARGQISRSGYFLTLDALGLKDFPTQSTALDQTERGTSTDVHMLCFDGELVPGIFQVRSKNTSHCFIHVLGKGGTVIEYIGKDPQQMRNRLLAALNDSGLQEQALHLLDQTQKAAAVDLFQVEGDVFTELTRAQEVLAHALIESESQGRFDLLKPIARGLTLASGMDLWQSQPSLLAELPAPSRLASELMRRYLKEQGHEHDPDHVFIAYRRGNSTTPLGSASTPAIQIRTPDEQPVSLSDALVSQYRVQTPVGYVDQGARTVVFLDQTGQGQWREEHQLTLDPYALEAHLKTLDFLQLMTQRINLFWEENEVAIEQAFISTFIAQALLALKQGRLTRRGFDLVVSSLSVNEHLYWHDLSFYVQGSVVDGLHIQHTALWLLEQPGKPNVLYQTGHPKAFVELADDDALNLHLLKATAERHWREAVMRHVPQRHHSRLDYLFMLWGRVKAPSPPVSNLRPWTSRIYNPDTSKAMQQELCKQKIEGSPFAFLSQRLKQNALMDAEDRIVTSAQLSLQDWTDWLYHLQMLLAPMSVLLTPALIASLATEIGITSLNIASANLPGSRYPEKNQALMATLSLGLLQLGPRTPGLARSLSRLLKPARQVARPPLWLPATLSGPTRQPARSSIQRTTRLETFFHTDALLKRWTVLNTPHFGSVPVHAWKLGRKFLLWTSDCGQARTLVLSTHGHYLPWSSTVKIPNGTELRSYAPHGYELVDPLLHRVVSKRVLPFAISSEAGNTPGAISSPQATLIMTDKLMAGTALPGRFKNYTLSKFQTIHHEPYTDIAHIVRNSNASPLPGQLPQTPMDVLTVRNRFGLPSPTLSDLFDTLSAQGIHYDRILLVHCRCAALSSLLKRAPVYKAPTVRPTIVKMP
ncbi:dermonecrotic toxin domain-containing protein [Pseudomonas sp. CDFA 610]|uniref:dermonecrotic toxin domain-containing protein n=1 Tax=Pseudomonas sp. CDFA 610 TaxID=2829825 RepID=UPI001E5FE7FD|nr:DUF6543 domain-containing protein [Pseudomonas sp. CDFA 610]MCD5984636.1 hypothetical protein [Pseudomonas sp. CDFA 610]